MIEINDFYLFKKGDDPILSALLRDAMSHGASTGDDVRQHAKESFGAIIYTSQSEGWWGYRFTDQKKLTLFLLTVQNA